MTSFQKLLKMVDYRSKDCVFGYIRQSCDKSKATQIPMMIQYCCLKYYFVYEYFTKGGVNLKFSDDKQSVTSIAENRWTFKCHAAFGNIIIDTSNKCIIKYKWTIKILEMFGGIFFWNNSIK